MKNLRFFGIIFIVSCVFINLVQGNKMDTYIKSILDSKKIPGCSIAILKEGALVKTKNYGYINLELKVPASSESIYQIASISKQFLAALVMMLVEEGVLSLNDPITNYLKNIPPSWKKITIQHLLNHTSGLPDHEKEVNLRKDYTDKELIKIVASLPLIFLPGDKFEYSNTGYMLLGMVVEAATGQFYGDLLKEYIFKPLHMDTAQIISEADIIPNRASGYRLEKGALKNQNYVSPTFNRMGDGSLCMSILDLAKWDKALGSKKLLKKSNWERMWEPTLLNDKKNATPYGFGWRLRQINGQKVIRHSGRWQGFSGHMAHYLTDKLTVIILCNLADLELAEVAYEIAELYKQEFKDAKRPNETALN